MLAFITGASSGIGKNMAYYLSEKGYDLIIVAKDETKLKEVQKNIKTKCEIISCDVAKESEVIKLFSQVKERDIDVAINNAGFGLFGEFVETDLDRELEMINVNIQAYHILTKLFLQKFVKEDKGYILNTCSMAGFMAGPRLSTYYATKNYITKLTMAINEELRIRKSNVSISALCPGPVNTNFNATAKGIFHLKEANAKEVAKIGIDGMLKKKMLIVPSISMNVFLFFLRLTPYRLQLKIAYNLQERID